MKNKYVQSGRVNQKKETRSRILASAQELMNQGQDFTLDDIAQHAGISRATIYRYFSNVEILANEAVLDISTKKPEVLHEELKDLELNAELLGIQDYFNTLAIDHENAFRKYLSVSITDDPSKIKRGARRITANKLALKRSGLSAKKQKDLAHLLTVMMGIEPLIVAKDVCGLDNQQSRKLLKWGMELIMKGLSAAK